MWLERRLLRSEYHPSQTIFPCISQNLSETKQEIGMDILWPRGSHRLISLIRMC